MADGGNNVVLENVIEDTDLQEESHVSCRDEVTYVENNEDYIKDDGDEIDHNYHLFLENSNRVDDSEYIKEIFEESLESPPCQIVENHNDENSTHQNGEHKEANCQGNDQSNIGTDSGNDKEESHGISSADHTDQHVTQIRENEDVCIYDTANIPNNEISPLPMDEKGNKEHTANVEECKYNSCDNIEQNDEKINEGEMIYGEGKKRNTECSESERGKENKKKPVVKEEGELTDDEESSVAEKKPKSICKFFNRGMCAWGLHCRFHHSGISDKGNYYLFSFAPEVKVEENNVDTEKKENGVDNEKLENPIENEEKRSYSEAFNEELILNDPKKNKH